MHIEEKAGDEQGRNAQELEDSVLNLAALTVLARRELGICDEVALFLPNNLNSAPLARGSHPSIWGKGRSGWRA